MYGNARYLLVHVDVPSLTLIFLSTRKIVMLSPGGHHRVKVHLEIYN